MGIEIRENIKADLGRRENKIPDTFCILIEAPHNVVFSIYPIAGIEDYESFLCGFGAAQCYGYVEREEDFELRSLRESALVETFAYLFKNLTLQPKWLKRYLKLDMTSDFLNFLYLRRLAEIRRLAGQLVYEIALHGDEDFRSKSDLYKERLEDATLCEQSETGYLVGVKPFFHNASILKGAIIEPALGNYLREKYDEEWWRKKEAGDFIQKMWREGGRLTSEELCKRLDIEQFSSSRLLEFFQKILG